MIFPFHERNRPDEPDAGTLPEAWLCHLDDNVLLYRLLSEEEQAKLRRIVPLFIRGKRWQGWEGLTITEEIQVTIAGQACLLLLGFEKYCFDNVKSVRVYPGSFFCGGYVLGVAAPRAPVELSWWHACWDGRRLGERNLVLHEFAHKLAELGDPDDGIPPLDDWDLVDRWDRVMGAAYEQLVEDACYERPTLLHPYGATNRSEFFSVATERFFLEPAALREEHPPVYQLLAEWYRQDPAERRPDPATVRQAREADEEYARHAVAEYSQSIERYGAAIKQVPDAIDAYQSRAEYYLALGEFEKALADYDAVLRLATGDERPFAYCERGRAHLAARSYERAVADFSEAIRRAPAFALAHWGRGAARSCLGHYEEALADLNRALQLDPKDDTAYVERAMVHKEMGRHAKALRDLARAIRLSPRSAAAYATRAWVLLAMGEYDRAIEDCDNAIRLAPGMAEPYKHRGVARYHQSAYDQALVDLDEAIRLDPKYVEAYCARADAHRALGSGEEARRDSARADELKQERQDRPGGKGG